MMCKTSMRNNFRAKCLQSLENMFQRKVPLALEIINLWQIRSLSENSIPMFFFQMVWKRSRY